MPSSVAVFDRAYYERFYLNPKTRVADATQLARLGDFVCSYLTYLDLPVRRVLDMGCGIGLWKPMIQRHFPKARYVGVEYSGYLCERYGWEQGSVETYQAKVRADLVLCQGVLPYLDDRAARRAIANLGELCAGALYLEAVTEEDWEQGVVDKRRTDRAMRRRPARFYRRALSKHFVSLGGGLWLSRRARVSLYELEKG